MMIQDIAHLGLIDEHDIELDAAALELALLDHPGVDLADYVALLESMTERLLSLAVLAETADEQAAALREVVAVEFGFGGDRETYDDPDNADLIRVVDRRRGMPIALSILYVALARRLGWSAHALNTPGHVLVAIGEEDPVIIDPFENGAIVEPRALAALLRHALGNGPMREDHVAPLSNRAALIRLLVNQASRFEQAGDMRRARKVHTRIVTIAPGYNQGWWELARLNLALGDVSAARDNLAALLETTQDPGIRAQAKRALASLRA